MFKQKKKIMVKITWKIEQQKNAKNIHQILFPCLWESFCTQFSPCYWFYSFHEMEIMNQFSCLELLKKIQTRLPKLKMTIVLEGPLWLKKYKELN